MIKTGTYTIVVSIDSKVVNVFGWDDENTIVCLENEPPEFFETDAAASLPPGSMVDIEGPEDLEPYLEPVTVYPSYQDWFNGNGKTVEYRIDHDEKKIYVEA